MLLRKKKQVVPPYSALAEIYDFVMNHVDYIRWAAFIKRIIERHNASVRNVLDASCGTGSLAFRLADLGFQVVGCDRSEKMLLIARQKNSYRSLAVAFWCADLKRFRLRRPVDLVLCTYDSINYLLHEKDWLACLDSAANALGHGGLFVFDVSTVYNSLHSFARFHQRERGDRFSYLRKSRFNKKTMIQKNYFEICKQPGHQMVYSETHIQRIRTFEEVCETITKSPFTLLAHYNNFSFSPSTPTSERIHFVLQKRPR